MNIGSRLVCILIYFYVLFQPLLPGKYKVGRLPLNGDAILALAIVVYALSVILFADSRKRFMRGLRDFFRNSTSIFMFLLALIMLISVSYAEGKTIALSETARFVTYILMFFIIKYEMSTRQIIVDWILRLYMVSTFIVSLIGIIEGICGIGFIQKSENGVRDRIFSTMENSNNLGVFMVMAIFPLIVLAISEKNRRKKVIFAVIAAMAFLNIVMSFSRNAWIGFVIGCIVLALTYSWKFIIALIAAGGISVFVPQITSRLSEFTDPAQNMSRIKLWDIAGFMIKDHPIRGVGNGNYRVLYDKYKVLLKQKIEYYPSKDFHPHNIILKVQSELGVFGTAVFVFMIISVFYRIVKFTRQVEDKFYTPFFRGFIASLAAFVCMNLIDNFFSAPKVIAFFWILIACFESVMYRQHMEGDLYY